MKGTHYSRKRTARLHRRAVYEAVAAVTRRLFVPLDGVGFWEFIYRQYDLHPEWYDRVEPPDVRVLLVMYQLAYGLRRRSPDA